MRCFEAQHSSWPEAKSLPHQPVIASCLLESAGWHADFKNVSIVAHYIKERTKNAQFIIISLRNNMFELADRLVGIYKTDDATKSVTINPSAFVVQPLPVAAN